MDEIEAEEEKPQPDFRVVQPEVDAEGNTKYTNVGALWKNESKNGNVFYTMRIGKMKLLVFPNAKK
ncbi:MAG: hypothetical protein QXP42_05565 [Candidatus Micrarchaeia archaeon]